MRILVYDATRASSWLDETWAIGAWWARKFNRFDRKIGATSWPDAIDKILSVSAGRTINELHYWGHGHWGKIFMGKKAINVVALASPHHPWHEGLVRLSMQMDEDSFVWFRVCGAFGNKQGRLFSTKLADFFGCRVASSTYLITTRHSGQRSLVPGQVPDWSTNEGVKVVDGKPKLIKSRFGAPRTIMFWNSILPKNW